MDSFLTEVELSEMGFARLGRDVKISRLSSFYSPSKIEINDFSRTDDFCRISGNVRIGRYVHVATHCCISASGSGVEMNDFSGLSSHCSIIATSDDYSGNWLTNPTVPSSLTNSQGEDVILGKHVVVGVGSAVMPGVTIGEGSASGAMTLFLNDAEPWGIYVGQPARRLKDRSKKVLELEKMLE